MRLDERAAESDRPHEEHASSDGKHGLGRSFTSITPVPRDDGVRTRQQNTRDCADGLTPEHEVLNRQYDDPAEEGK